MERNLLLVDDDEGIGGALFRLFRFDGYNILRANSGFEGLEILAKYKIGVVISDQRMPEMSGVEFLTRVKELYPQTIRIVLSGHADIAAVTDAVNRGSIYKFFTKPWDGDDLSSEVRDAFELYELTIRKEGLLQEIQSANVLLAQINLQLATAVAQKDNQLERIRNFDTLTNLPNRSLYLDRLDHEITRAHRENHLVAVLMVDLDRFKQINELFGHAFGDQLLRTVADRLSGYLRESDTVARVGGDGFGLVLADLKRIQDAGEVAEKIIAAFDHDPICITEIEIFVSVSIGISVYPVDGDNTTMLFNNADVALLKAKDGGRNNYKFYAEHMNQSARQRLKMETELHRALERDEFVLYYQPKVDLKSGCIVGMEALLRWQSADRGLVTPMEFIPLLEETGLIVSVGNWVLREACRQASQWLADGLSGVHIAVNLSTLQFRKPDFANSVLAILKEYGLDPSLRTIELELTESQLINNVVEVIETLKLLHDSGVDFSIDDFGTGYSSLSYLKRFPIDSLKIDQSFVRDLSNDGDDEAIVAAIIALGHSLGLEVIAEGVETREQLARLRTMNCDVFQGYLFSRPIPAHEMTCLLLGMESRKFCLEG